MPILDKKIEDEANYRTVALPSEAPADKDDRKVYPFPGAKPEKDKIGPTWGPNPADKEDMSWVRTPSQDGEKNLEQETRDWQPLPGFPNRVPLSAAMRGQPYPAMSDRERKERGEAKTHDKLNYRKNRQKILHRSKTWYKRYKNTPMLQNDRERRRKNPDKYKRLPGGWDSHSEKEKDRREQEQDKDKPDAGIASRLAAHYTYQRRCGSGWTRFVLGRTAAVARPAGIGYLWVAVRTAAGWRQGRCAAAEFMRRATWPMISKPERPDADPQDRQWRVYPERELPAPWTDPEFGDIPDLPGPQRMLPRELPKKIRATADALEAAIRGVASDVAHRAGSLRVDRGRPDPRGFVRFTVRSAGGEPHEVDVLRAGPRAARVRCSCPAWVFQGCEYHARRGGYLLGSPRGPATAPRVRDPRGQNLLCKHAVAVLRRMRASLSPGDQRVAARIARQALATSGPRSCGGEPGGGPRSGAPAPGSARAACRPHRG